MTTKTTTTAATTTTTTTSTDGQEFQVLTGVRDIVDRYDTFLLDMWYVHHCNSLHQSISQFEKFMVLTVQKTLYLFLMLVYFHVEMVVILAL